MRARVPGVRRARARRPRDRAPAPRSRSWRPDTDGVAALGPRLRRCAGRRRSSSSTEARRRVGAGPTRSREAAAAAGLPVLDAGAADATAIERSAIGFLVNHRAELERQATLLETPPRAGRARAAADPRASPRRSPGSSGGRSRSRDGGGDDPRGPRPARTPPTRPPRVAALPPPAPRGRGPRSPLPIPGGEPDAAGGPRAARRSPGDRARAGRHGADRRARGPRAGPRRGGRPGDRDRPARDPARRRAAVGRDRRPPGAAGPATTTDGARPDAGARGGRARETLRAIASRPARRMAPARRRPERRAPRSWPRSTRRTRGRSRSPAGSAASWGGSSRSPARSGSRPAGPPPRPTRGRRWRRRRRLAEPPAVARADRLPAYRLLGNLHNLPEGKRQARALLAPLLRGRPDVRRERLATLRAVLDQPGLAEAADALGVHRNTIAYRVRRIEAATGWRLADPELRFPLALALRLVQDD